MEELKLSEYADIFSGYAFSTDDMKDEGVPILKIGNINSDGTITLTSDSNYPHEVTKKFDKFWLRKSDFLVCMTGATIGKIGRSVCVKEKQCLVNQRVGIIRSKGNINNDYLYYILALSDFKRYIEIVGSGAAQANISAYDIGKFTIRCNKNEKIQNKIAKTLSNYDGLIENNNKRIKLLEQMAEELYKEWFVRFRFPGYEDAYVENTIPNGWKYVNLFEIGNVIYGFPFDSSKFCDNDSLNPVVRIRDIPGNNTFTYTSEVCDSKYIIKKNDILVGMDGIFHMCLWNGEYALLNQRVVKINSKKKDFSELLLYLSIYNQIKFWEATLCGTTVSHLGDKHLKRMKVLLPPKEVLVKTNNIFTNIMNEKANLLAKNKKLIKQRDLLLPRLMSGKIDLEDKEVI